MTIPTGKNGKYLIIGNIFFGPNATGERLIAIYKNGAQAYVAEVGPVSSTANYSIAIQAIMDLVATDYIEIYAYQNSGGARNVYRSQFNGLVYLGA